MYCICSICIYRELLLKEGPERLAKSLLKNLPLCSLGIVNVTKFELISIN